MTEREKRLVYERNKALKLNSWQAQKIAQLELKVKELEENAKIQN